MESFIQLLVNSDHAFSYIKACTISRLRFRELDRFCLNGLSQLGDEERILTTISLKSILFNKYEV